MSAHSAPMLIPNGDFSTPGGSGFGSFASDGTVISYPESGGNSGGYGKINNAAGDWGGGLVAPADSPPLNLGIPLATLGLVAGETYTFSMDMINLDGTTGVGGLKLESWSDSGFISTDGDVPASGQSSTWANYTWTYKIADGATSIKLVPLLTPATYGAGQRQSVIGFDNIMVDNTPIPPPPFVPDQIINGDFETPGGAGWGTVQGTPNFPTTGGNPDGNAELNGTSGFAVLYAFDNSEKEFASLGLAPGDTYTVQMDMKLISGSNIGGLRLEGPAGYVVEQYPTIIDGGTAWKTYSIELTVPASPAQAKFGLRPGNDSVVAFDNVSIVVPQQTPFVAELKRGTVVSWEAAGADYSYQAQKSEDEVTWTDFGPLVIGEEVTSSFDAEGAAFYQVLETPLTTIQLVVDPGFEDSSESWNLQGSNPPVLVDDSGLAHDGNMSMRMSVDNEGVAIAKTSTLLQSGLGILPTDVLDFTFWAFIESRVDANMFYSIKWDNGAGVFSQVDGSMNALPVGEWTQVSVLGLEPPTGTVSAFVEFGCVTGAVPEHQGSVLIDDVTLITADFNPDDALSIPATPTPGVEISWSTKNGSTYQAKSSTNLSGFMNFGPAIEGDGGTASVFEVLTPPAKFYQVVETP